MRDDVRALGRYPEQLTMVAGTAQLGAAPIRVGLRARLSIALVINDDTMHCSTMPTPQNVVGAAAGAMPPVLGWAAVTNDVSHEAVFLAIVRMQAATRLLRA
jgi:hypothetical protein